MKFGKWPSTFRRELLPVSYNLFYPIHVKLFHPADGGSSFRRRLELIYKTALCHIAKYGAGILKR
jgi:hypothetical protein